MPELKPPCRIYTRAFSPPASLLVLVQCTVVRSILLYTFLLSFQPSSRVNHPLLIPQTSSPRFCLLLILKCVPLCSNPPCTCMHLYPARMCLSEFTRVCTLQPSAQASDRKMRDRWVWQGKRGACEPYAPEKVRTAEKRRKCRHGSKAHHRHSKAR